jgi:uncharacterized protein YyaL (SSP411 family)
MERESFEDSQVADLLNSYFVCIKVDREERPDIDDIYMTVCQMMTGRGGWPLTIIMTPDRKPFFTGTYIPKSNRHGMTGLMDLVPKIHTMWKNQREEIIDSAEGVTETLRRYSAIRKGGDLDDSIMSAALGDFLTDFDESYGGFGSEPKFPTPHTLLFLLRNWKRIHSKETLHMVEKTLDAMGLGGIRDHVGGGFHRYSTDRFWLVPHFEKMLYDQALLAMAYTEAYQVTHKKEYEEVVQGIFKYVLRDMTSPAGGFYSAEDADSEGEEGKFYLWTESEIREVLGDNADLFIKIFGITKNGNFAEETTGKKTKRNILHLSKDLKQWSKDMNIPLDDLKRQIDAAIIKLLKARETRIRPYKDDKILCDWNGLAIAALAKAYQVFGDKLYIEVAESSAEFILNNMMDKGRLLHRIKDGEAIIPGFLSDYSFFIWGLLELYEATFKNDYLRQAIEFTKHVNKHFWDEKGHGYYSTSDYAEELLVRKKANYDGAIPSANSVTMMNLLKLGRITGDSSYEERASELQRVFSKKIESLPTAHTMFLSALDFAKGPTYEVVITGDFDSEDTIKAIDAIRREYIPNKVVVHKPVGKGREETEALIPYTKEMVPIEGKTTIYVCQNFTCSLPTTDLDEVLKMLKEE